CCSNTRCAMMRQCRIGTGSRPMPCSGWWKNSWPRWRRRKRKKRSSSLRVRSGVRYTASACWPSPTSSRSAARCRRHAWWIHWYGTYLLAGSAAPETRRLDQLVQQYHTEYQQGTRMNASLTDQMTTKRLARFVPTQFLGACNDNVFRQALILLIATGVVTGVSVNTLNNVGLALFILPFFLFSAIAGQLADKYEKSMLLRRIKFAEILIMCAGAIGFYFDAVYFLLAVLFCMGLQSTFFGPIKYSIIPQHLNDKELVSGNALVEMGTFLAILLGSIAGVVLKMEGTGEWV